MAPGIDASLSLNGFFAKTSKNTTVNDHSTLVLNHTSVTKDFDTLKFEAAASKQLVLRRHLPLEAEARHRRHPTVRAGLPLARRGDRERRPAEVLVRDAE